MALGNRYILYVNDVNDGYRYRARIQQEGAASAIELRPVDARNGAAELFAGEQGTQDPAAPLVRSSMSFRVLKTQGALVSVFGEAMDAFPVIWERQLLSANPTTGPWSTIWRGFLHTRYYEDAPDAFVDEVVLKAHDGIELLKTREYEGVTNSDSVWTTLTGILGGLGFGFGYETIMRWYPYLSSHRTSRILEYLYTQDERWGDENEEDLRLSEYDVLVDLLGRFQLQLVQSEGAFHLRQRYNLIGDEDIVEVYNSSGVYTGTGTVDTVNVDPITELQGRPRSFLSQVKHAQSTHEHGDLDELVEDGSFEIAAPALPPSTISGEWEVLRSGVTRQAIKDISDDAPTEDDQFAAKITIGASGQETGLKQGGLVLLSPSMNHAFRLSFDAMRDDTMGQFGRVLVRSSYDLSTPASGFFLSAVFDFAVATSWLKGEDAPLHVREGFGRHDSGYVDGTAILPAGATIWIYDQTTDTFVTYIRLTRPAKVGDRTLYGDIGESFDVDRDGAFTENRFLLYYAVWLPVQTTGIQLPRSTWDVESYFGQPIVPVRRFGHFEYRTNNVTPGGIPVEGYLEWSLAAGSVSGTADSGHYYAFDNIGGAIEDAEGRTIDKAIYAASTDKPQDDTESLAYSFLTGDGPTKRSRARLSVLDGSGARQEITGGWKNGPYTSGEASTQLSIDALHTRLSIRQRKKHLAVRRITFLLHEGESIWPHHVITRGGVNYTIGRYERSFGTGQVYTELIELFQGSDDGIADAVVQEGPSAQGTGGRTLLAVSSGGGGGASDWASITGKPPLVNTFNTRSGDITLTSADVTGALGFTPISLDAADARYVNVTGDTMTGDLVMASGTLKVNTDHLILDADGAAPGYVKLSSGRIGQQIGAGGTFEPFARTNAAETISGAYTFTALATFTPAVGSASKALAFNHAYGIYVDNTGAGSNNTRLWLDTPDGGEVVIGPRTGNNELTQFRVRSTAIKLETANYTGGVVSSYGAITVDGGTFGSLGFVSRTTGAQINFTTGAADFRSIYADELVVQAFTADVAQTLVGSEYITKSRATLAADFVVPAVGATATLTVEDLADVEIGPGAQVFASGDTIRLRYINRATGLTVGDAWGTVTGYVDNGDGTQSWTWTSRKLSSGVSGKTINKGSVALDYGVSGDKLIVSTVLDAMGSPYTRMLQWTDTNGDFAPDTYAVLASMGNLGGITGTVAGQSISGYGFYSDNAYFKGVAAITKGYFGADGHIVVGDGLSAHNLANKLLVGNWTPAGSSYPIVKLLGPTTSDAITLQNNGAGTWGIFGQVAGATVFSLGSTNQIAGWKFVSSRIFNDTAGTGNVTGMQATSNSLAHAFFAGANDALGNNAKFFVRHDGFLFAAAGTFAGALQAATGTFSGSLTAATVTGTLTVSGGSIVAGQGSVTLDNDGILLAAGETTRNAVKWGDGTTWIRGNNNDITIHADQNIRLGNAATFPSILANGAFRVVQSVATFDRYLNIPIYNYDSGPQDPAGLTPYEAPNPMYGKLHITRNNVGGYFVRVYLPNGTSVVLN